MSTKLFAVFLLIIVCTINAFSQARTIDEISARIKSLNAGKNILLEYDKASNYSKLMLLSDGFGTEQNRRNGLSSFTFGMMYGFNGRELTITPDVFILTFWARGKNTGFARSHSWKALVDGQTVELGEARYARKNGDEREFLNFAVLRTSLETISSGTEVTFLIGNAEFKLTPDQLRMFANFLSVSNSGQ